MITDLKTTYTDTTAGLFASMVLDFRRRPGEANLTSASQTVPRLQAATLDGYDSRWPFVGWVIEADRSHDARIAPTGAGYSIQPLDATTTEPASNGSLGLAEVWARLVTAAETGDERSFVAAYESLDWTIQSPDAIMRAVRLAITAGAPLVARRLATEGAQRHPEHIELQTAARILAPPRVLRSDLPPEPGMAKNIQWLRSHREQYQNRWVAIREGQLLGTADTLHALIERVGKREDILYTVA